MSREDKDFVVVDLHDVVEATDDEVTVPIVSERYDDPHEASAEAEIRSGHGLEMVSIEAEDSS